METEERLAFLERKVAEYDRLIAVLTVYAKTTKTGRIVLKMLGVT